VALPAERRQGAHRLAATALEGLPPSRGDGPRLAAGAGGGEDLPGPDKARAAHDNGQRGSDDERYPGRAWGDAAGQHAGAEADSESGADEYAPADLAGPAHCRHDAPSQ